MELILLNGCKSKKNHSKILDTSKITTNLKNTFYEEKEIQDIMKEFYQIKRNLIIQHKFINFSKMVIDTELKFSAYT